jgi:hypothetical protein
MAQDMAHAAEDMAHAAQDTALPAQDTAIPSRVAGFVRPDTPTPGERVEVVAGGGID